MLVVAFVLMAAAYVALVVVAFVQAWRADSLAEWSRLAWFAVILMAPLIGALAWFLWGRETWRLEGLVQKTLRR